MTQPQPAKSDLGEIFENLKPPSMIWDARWDQATQDKKLREAEAHLRAAEASVASVSRMMTTAVSMHATARSWADTCRAFRGSTDGS